MLDMISNFLTTVDDFVWGIPLIVLILATGLFLTARLHFLQITKLPHAIKHLIANEKSGEDGEVSSFAALCTALSATIGTGNIVGVATAIVAGGPGALFWMWIAALVGTATKYSECLLAVKYRVVAEDGHIIGGPFYYIENGMGKSWKWLAKIFAFMGVCVGLFGIGTFTQINGITSAVHNFFDANNAHTVQLFGMDYSWSVVISGILLTICVALVVIGGLKRISTVAQVIVPFMAVTYVVACLLVLIFNVTAIPAAIVTIVQSAFGMRAVAGGALGAVIMAMQKGIARGIFSNEAGIGSAPIAAAAAQNDSPAKQGLISMMGTIIDTLIICTMTGLTIVITDSWNVGLDGVDVTTRAFQQGLPFNSSIASFILMVCLVFFAFTTILGWDYYSERCLEYLIGQKPKPVLLVSCGYKNFPGTDVYNRHWMHDVGAANISIALQAASMGMQLHQMAGFDVEACTRLLGLDTEKIEPVTMMTLGYPGPADRLAEPFRTRETLPRERKEVKSFVHKLE